MNELNGDLPPQNDDQVTTDLTNTITTTDENNDLYQQSNITQTTIDEDDSLVLSPVLMVSNLVRPFTLTGLKKVLTKCGKILENKFWLNKDKTKCYICYEDEKIADESRKYINSLKWPASNPNTLKSVFSSLDVLDELIRKDEEERIQLERERKQAAELEAIKQEERKQQLKEELARKFNESLIGSDSIIEHTNGDHLLSANSTIKSNVKEEQESISERPVSPAKNSPSNVLSITNLQRGFTEKQFKELLSKHGKLIDEKFWIDKLKSRSYVVYESTEDALKARNYLHGLKWPRSNTRTLRVDFGKLSDVNELLNNCEAKTKEELSIKSNKETYNDNKNEDQSEEERPSNGTQINQMNLGSKQLQNESTESTNVKRKIIPAKNNVSNIVYINGLSRPFTIPQLKELLSQDGHVDEKRFWIDRLKSHCYAVYENDEIAIKTRDRLHGLRWPVGNSRKLYADFATELELESKLNLNRLDQASKEIHKQERTKEEENRIREKLIRNIDSNHGVIEKEKGCGDEEMNVESHQDLGGKRKRDLSPGSSIKKREHHIDQSPKEQSHNRANNVKESPGKTLETLFRKTQATPSIYWMPLDEIAIKQRDDIRERQRIERAEEEERKLRQKKEAEVRIRQFNDHNGFRRRSPWRRERMSPYHSSRNYGPPQNRNYGPPDRYMPDRRPIVRSPVRPDYSNKRMMDRPPQMPERTYNRPMRTPSRSPVRRGSIDKQQDRGRKRTPVKRHSRSSSAVSTRSSGSSSSSRSGSGSRSPPPTRTANKRPVSPRSPPRRHSRSPPRRYNNDRRLPPTRR